MTSLVSAGAQELFIRDGQLPVISTVARVRAGDLETARADLAEALSQPVQLTYSKKKWTLEPEQLAQFVIQDVDTSKQGADAFTVEVDEQSLATWLDGLVAADIEKAPVNAKVAWSDKKKALIATEKSRKGARLKPLSLAREVVQSFWGDHKAVNVPVTVLQPDVDSDNLEALGITTKLAVGDSSYVGSNDGRATNIVVGSGLLNGALIPPHGIFSFNHAIGVIEVEKGYVEASVIQGERIGRDVGGGICQVSTTVFRAALLAGVPIVEWWPHTYRLGFYEQDGWAPGFDASILQPNDDPFSGGDFRFENPTDSWMLVESYTADERVYVIIYGAKTGYEVQFTEPQISGPIPPPDHPLEVVDSTLEAGTVQQSELAQPGYEVVFDRIVTDKDGNEVMRDTWDTVFASRPDVWKVSPDMEGQSPGAE
jgi:vancomycin resistance protein YoaR